MRRLVQIILLKPILWASRKFTSRPERSRIFKALSELFRNIKEEPGKKGIILTLKENSRIIVFSDQHRGAKNGADDFMKAEGSYLAALEYYFQNQFQFISLGDSEELWENTLNQVKKHNSLTFEAEKKFILQDRFIKVFGNHDLYWDNTVLASQQLKTIYDKELRVFEGVILELRKNRYNILAIEDSHKSSEDEMVLEIFLKENSLLMTEDKDFGELVFRLNKAHIGIFQDEVTEVTRI